MNEKWVGISEAADYLDIKAVTLRNWIRDCDRNFLPVWKVGKMRKFKLSELDAWIKSGRGAIW